MKHWKRYILNLFLLFVVGYNILPNFSLNKNDFEVVTGLISSVKKESEDFNRPKEMLFNNIVRQRLIITIADSNYHEYYVSDIYKKHWGELLSYHKSEKPITLYLGKGKQEEDPFRIEIDATVIYDTNVRFYRNALILLFTLVFTLYNLFTYFKSQRKVINTMPLNPTKPSFLLRVKDKLDEIKHYFLK